ncbi:hypothetical protein JOQ06_019164, partial [Pogonophryne albipinna]
MEEELSAVEEGRSSKTIGQWQLETSLQISSSGAKWNLQIAGNAQARGGPRLTKGSSAGQVHQQLKVQWHIRAFKNTSESPEEVLTWLWTSRGGPWV